MEELNKFIASDIEHTGKVVTINGKSRLLIDGKITAPVINGPSSRFEPGKTFSNAKLFSAQGIDLTRVGIRLGNTVTNKGFWKGKDDFDVDSLDLVELIMAIEDEFEIEISDEDFDDVKTVSDALDYLEKRI